MSDEGDDDEGFMDAVGDSARNAVTEMFVKGGIRMAGRAMVRAYRGSAYGHCRHCKGEDGPCRCEKSCKVKSDTKCSAAWAHCHHCRGQAGEHCTCTQQCEPRGDAMCIAVHDETCDKCHRQPILSSLYRCAECPNYNLCRQCYHTGCHRMHGFEKVIRPGEPTIFIKAKDPNYSCHVGVACDSCKEFPIEGPRFSCTVHSDYDLCLTCYNTGVHSQHDFVRYDNDGDKPVPAGPRTGKTTFHVPGAASRTKSKDTDSASVKGPTGLTTFQVPDDADSVVSDLSAPTVAFSMTNTIRTCVCCSESTADLTLGADGKHICKKCQLKKSRERRVSKNATSIAVPFLCTQCTSPFPSSDLLWCTQCDVRLCESCFADTKHEHEDFLELGCDVADARFMIGCDGCGEQVQKVTHQCQDRHDFHLCTNCIRRGRGQGQQYHRIEISSVFGNMKAVSLNTGCDECGTEEYESGMRFRCIDCEDFNLCSKCFTAKVISKHDGMHTHVKFSVVDPMTAKLGTVPSVASVATPTVSTSPKTTKASPPAPSYVPEPAPSPQKPHSERYSVSSKSSSSTPFDGFTDFRAGQVVRIDGITNTAHLKYNGCTGKVLIARARGKDHLFVLSLKMSDGSEQTATMNAKYMTEVKNFKDLRLERMPSGGDEKSKNRTSTTRVKTGPSNGIKSQSGQKDSKKPKSMSYLSTSSSKERRGTTTTTTTTTTYRSSGSVSGGTSVRSGYWAASTRASPAKMTVHSTRSSRSSMPDTNLGSNLLSTSPLKHSMRKETSNVINDDEGTFTQGQKVQLIGVSDSRYADRIATIVLCRPSEGTYVVRVNCPVLPSSDNSVTSHSSTRCITVKAKSMKHFEPPFAIGTIVALLADMGGDDSAGSTAEVIGFDEDERLVEIVTIRSGRKIGVPADMLKTFVTDDGSTATRLFKSGQKVRLEGVSNPLYAGKVGTVLKHIPNDGVCVVRISCGDGDKEKSSTQCLTFRQESLVLVEPSFAIGSLVQVKPGMSIGESVKETAGEVVGYVGDTLVEVLMFGCEQTTTVSESMIELCEAVEGDASNTKDVNLAESSSMVNKEGDSLSVKTASTPSIAMAALRSAENDKKSAGAFISGQKVLLSNPKYANRIGTILAHRAGDNKYVVRLPMRSAGSNESVGSHSTAATKCLSVKSDSLTLFTPPFKPGDFVQLRSGADEGSDAGEVIGFDEINMKAEVRMFTSDTSVFAKFKDLQLCEDASDGEGDAGDCRQESEGSTPAEVSPPELSQNGASDRIFDLGPKESPDSPISPSLTQKETKDTEATEVTETETEADTENGGAIEPVMPAKDFVVNQKVLLKGIADPRYAGRIGSIVQSHAGKSIVRVSAAGEKKKRMVPVRTECLEEFVLPFDIGESIQIVGTDGDFGEVVGYDEDEMLVKVAMLGSGGEMSVPAERLQLRAKEDAKPPFERGDMVQLLCGEDQDEDDSDDICGEVLGFNPKENLVEVLMFHTGETSEVDPGLLAPLAMLS